MAITKNDKIIDVIEKHPQTIKVFKKYQLGCLGCAAAETETIQDIAQVHGINLDSFVKELTEALSENE